MTSRQKLNNGIFIRVSGLKGEPVLIKISGLVTKSTNSKTGQMVQSVIAPESWHGKGFLLDKAQKAVCGECPFSSDGPLMCYTHRGMQMLGLKSTLRSSKPNPDDWDRQEILDALEGLPFRFGTYGDPVLFGEKWVRDITSVASTWTGYTHQWRDLRFSWASEFLMASVHTEEEASHASVLGWRTFRTGKHQLPTHGEIVCPASKEAGRIATCESCGLCRGSSLKAKSIYINEH